MLSNCTSSLRAQSTYIQYIEYHNVCPLSELGLSHPLSPVSVPLPPDPKGEGHSEGEGLGEVPIPSGEKA
jgi:hypothetical protein